ncbi:hypothetical protein CW304_21290 [Bacillus sp. UFRGS-B20]|nr:hypothetical protein CW304_21290 [Bacillus sp. UFRGS-B20]
MFLQIKKITASDPFLYASKMIFSVHHPIHPLFDIPVFNKWEAYETSKKLKKDTKRWPEEFTKI